MPLTATQRDQIQRIYSTVVSELKAKYGPDLVLEGASFNADESGKLVGILVHINIQTAPDVDGDSTRMRKSVNIW